MEEIYHNRCQGAEGGHDTCNDAGMAQVQPPGGHRPTEKEGQVSRESKEHLCVHMQHNHHTDDKNGQGRYGHQIPRAFMEGLLQGCHRMISPGAENAASPLETRGVNLVTPSTGQASRAQSQKDEKWRHEDSRHLQGPGDHGQGKDGAGQEQPKFKEPLVYSRADVNNLDGQPGPQA